MRFAARRLDFPYVVFLYRFDGLAYWTYVWLDLAGAQLMDASFYSVSATPNWPPPFPIQPDSF